MIVAPSRMTPAKSNGASRRRFGMSRVLRRARATSPSGRLTRKIDRHPARPVRTPPTTGPASEATAKQIENHPMYFAPSRGVNISPSEAPTETKRPPEPAPCSTRPGDEQRGRRRQAAGERTEQEQDERAQEHAFAAEDVTELAVEGSGDAPGEQVGGGDPGVGPGPAELGGDPGERGGDDLGVEHREEDGQEQAGKGRVWARFSAVVLKKGPCFVRRDESADALRTRPVESGKGSIVTRGRVRPLRARKPPRIVPLARPNPDGVLTKEH